MSRPNQANKRPISERISIFEKQSTTTSTVSVSSTSVSSPKLPVSRTITGKNFDSIKSQFNVVATPPSSTRTKLPSSTPSTPVVASTITSAPSVDPVGSPDDQRNARSQNPSPLPQDDVKISQPQHQPLTRTPSKKTPTNTMPIHSSLLSGKKATPASKAPSRSATSPIHKPTNPSSRQSSTLSLVSGKISGGELGMAPAEKSASKAVSSKSLTAPISSNKISSANINGSNKKNESIKEDNLVIVPTNFKSTTLNKMMMDKSSPTPIINVAVEPLSPKVFTPSIVSKEETRFQQKVLNREDVSIQNQENIANSNLIKKGEIVNEDNSSSGGRTYWTNQVLLNDNSEKIKQANKLDLQYDVKLDNVTKGFGEDLQSTTDDIKRQKHDLNLRLKEQEEELEDLTSQVQMLDQAKTKLELELASLKKDHRKEVSSKQDELEDARAAAQKKIKALEQQLEVEHEEKTHFAREKQELQMKIKNLKGTVARSPDEDQVVKLKKDVKRMKALLKDAQAMFERSQFEGSGKVVLRQLKNQLEDAEFSRIAALKAKQNAEMEVSDVQQQLDDVLRSKSDSEDKLFNLAREKANLSSHLADNERQLQDVMKRYKASVAQLSVDQITISDQANIISELEEERNRLKENLAESAQRIQSMEGDNVSAVQHARLEMKVKELETKLELELTSRGRLETQLNRQKESIGKLNYDYSQLMAKEAAANELVRKLQKQLKEGKEALANLQQKETEVNGKKSELEKQLELAEVETATARNDLKLATKRIEDLQNAINGELDSETDSVNSGNESEDGEVIHSFLDQHRRTSNAKRERMSLSRISLARQLKPMAEQPEGKCFNGNNEQERHNGDKSSDKMSQLVQGVSEEESQA